MKNIHILPTNKPSRLALQLDWKHNYNLQLSKIADDWTFNWQKQNIYITSDEEIKEGDWFVHTSYGSTSIQKALEVSNHILDNQGMISNKEYNLKIILTTDKNLIADGVQAIDDEFLEWFVKNPSCEEVETKLIEEIPSGFTFGTFGNDEPPTELVYKIIIPKEKPKQDALNHFSSTSSVIVKDPQISNFNKQETLEEAATKLLWKKYPYHPPRDSGYWQDMFIEGAKWQQERSYSEEEVKNIVDETIEKFYKHFYTLTKAEMKDKWFEQFKKK